MIPAYERQPYRTELDVEIVDRGADAEGAYVVLDDTILYPEGGGQPADHGWLGEAAIGDVQRIDGEIRHYVGGPISAPAARLRLDWRRRFDHMQQHTAQHLITALAAEELGWETTSFHLGASSSDIELAAPAVPPEAREHLEQTVAARIREAVPVAARRLDAAAYANLEVRSRGLPAGHAGDIRLVEIRGVDSNTCGGTHVANTAQIETVVLLDSEPLRGGTRLHWIAGGRVRDRLHRQAEGLAAMRRLLETSDEELAAVAAVKLTRLREAERRLQDVGEALAGEVARRLRASGGALIDEHFEGGDARFLQQVARRLLADGEQRAALLTAGGAGGGFFVLSAAAGSGLDLHELGTRVATALAGRGGGSGDLVQGKAGSLAGRNEAARLLARALADRSVSE